MNGLKKATKIVSFIYLFILPTAMLITLVLSLVLFGSAQDENFVQKFAQQYSYEENGQVYQLTEQAAAATINLTAVYFLIFFLLLIPGLIFDIVIFRSASRNDKTYSRGVWIRNGVLALVFGAEIPGILSIVYGAIYGNRQNASNVPPSGNSNNQGNPQTDNYWNYSDREEVNPDDEDVVDAPKDDGRPKPSDYDAPDHPSDD